MLFSLIGFETQTCTIICEFICNIIFRCNPAYVMCICLITRSWLWCWFTEVFRDTRRTTGFIWVKVCACQRVSGDNRTWSCINWTVLLQRMCLWCGAPSGPTDIEVPFLRWTYGQSASCKPSVANCCFITHVRTRLSCHFYQNEIINL